MASKGAKSHYDALILGSGQSGTPLATAFARAGRSVALVEASHIGGTCVNEGCTPTKTMIASGRSAYLARRAGEYGVRIGGDINVDMAAIRQRKRDIVASWSKGGEDRLTGAGVDIIWGAARFLGVKTVDVMARTNEEGAATTPQDGRKVTADTVVINTGARPSRPPIPGLEDVPVERVLDSTSIMEVGTVPDHLVVVGGGYIGLEFGQLFRRLGSRVTIVQRNAQLVPREDQDVAVKMLEILEQDGIQVYLSAHVESMAPRQQEADAGSVGIDVNITTESRESVSLPGSHVLLAAGRTPNTDMLDLAAAGVKASPKGYVSVDDKLETNVPGIYAIGDVHGGPAFTHMSYDDSRILRTNLLPGSLAETAPRMTTTTASTSRRLTPYVVYTDPQLGHVGLHTWEAKAQRRNIKTATMPMTYVARAIETAETRGLMKATVDAETGEILGFTCLGIEGGEIMAIVQTAMMGGVKWWDLEAAVFSHPSLAESLNNMWAYLE